MFNSMRQNEENAKVEYAEILVRDAGKTYLELLPKIFNTNSYIGKHILKCIDGLFEFINKCTLYDGQQFTKEDIVHWMLSGTKYHHFYLARFFIPQKSSMHLWSKWYMDNIDKYPKDDKDDTMYKDYRLANNEILEEYEELEGYLNGLEKYWENFQERVAVKTRTRDFEIEADGFPRQGRGNMCYAYYPVKGDIANLEIDGVYNFYNPRSKKDVELKILEKRPTDNEYKCLMNGQEIFICEYEEVEESWSCLFTINKQIYSGWWNRTLIY